jgi:hypothetical protein
MVSSTAPSSQSAQEQYSVDVSKASTRIGGTGQTDAEKNQLQV